MISDHLIITVAVGIIIIIMAGTITIMAEDGEDMVAATTMATAEDGEEATAVRVVMAVVVVGITSSLGRPTVVCLALLTADLLDRLEVPGDPNSRVITI